jgi:hypothetical protein
VVVFFVLYRGILNSATELQGKNETLEKSVLTMLPIIDRMDSVDKQKKQVIENLLKTIPQNEKVLDFAADSITQDKGDPVYKKWVELCFYIAYVDNEVKYMLHATLSDKKAFIYLDKYTALIMYEAIETLPKLYSDFFRTLEKVENEDGQNRFDRDKLREGYRNYKEAIKPIKNDSAFMQSLSTVRNNIAAHHLDKEKSIHTLVDWYVRKRQEIDEQNNLGASSLILYAAKVAQSLSPLAQSLIHAIQTTSER